MARVFKGSVYAAALFSCLASVFAAHPASAKDISASYAAVGNTTRTPYGWADLCGRQPQECQVDVLDPVDLHLTDRTFRILDQVNAQVNGEITPTSNLEHWGTVLDRWDYPTDGKGDCKIYALWKRKLLIDRGFPRQALLMTIVRDLDGNGHTILTVKTDRGEFILDNMVGEIRSWDATGYTFVKRQSQSDPNVWVAVGPAEGHFDAHLDDAPSSPTSSVDHSSGEKSSADKKAALGSKLTNVEIAGDLRRTSAAHQLGASPKI